MLSISNVRHSFTVFIFLLLSIITSFGSHAKVPELEWFHIDDEYTWVYGAYWDIRPRKNVFVKTENIVDSNVPYLRIYATGAMAGDIFSKNITNWSCHYYFNGLYDSIITPLVSVQPSLKDWRSHSYAKSKPYYLYCNSAEYYSNQNLPKNMSLSTSLRIPFSVSIFPNDFSKFKWKSDHENRFRKWLIPIRGSYNDLKFHHLQKPKDILAICVKPFLGSKNSYGFYNDYDSILNFLIYYSSLGVKHFILYNQGVVIPRIIRLIETIQSSFPTLQIDWLPWRYHELHGHDMFQTMNIESCVHNLLLQAENVLVVDFDELLVPQAHSDLPSLIQFLDAKYPLAAVYQFSTALFYAFDDPGAPVRTNHICPNTSTTDRKSTKIYHSAPCSGYIFPFQNDSYYMNISSTLSIFRKIHRTTRFPITRRSKYIVKPMRVHECGIHSAIPLAHKPEYKIYGIQHGTAGVNHYRSARLGGSREGKSRNGTVKDTSIYLHYHKILENPLYSLLIK